MPLLVQCPSCKKLLGGTAKVCRTKTGKGCGAKIPHDRKIYYAQWRDPNGKTKQKKIGPHKKAAENFLLKQESAVIENRYIDKAEEAPKVLISDFVEQDYKPWCKNYNKGYKSKLVCLNHILNNWGHLHLDELTDWDIDKYRLRMKKANKPIMFNRAITVLSHMYSIAVQYGKIDRQPFSIAKKKFREQGRLRYLLPDDAKRLVDACQDHLQPIVITALHTGMRKGEILTLRLGVNVDLDERRISLQETKNGEKRYLPMNETVYEVLARVAKDKAPGDYLFPGMDGKPLTDVKRSFKSALKESGIENFRFHDLRHTFASNLAMQGVDLPTIKELMGHKDIKMTLRYAHLSPDHQAQAVTILDGLFEATSKANVISQISVKDCVNR